MSNCKIFCPLPWVHLSTEATTAVRPCCIHKRQIQKENGSYYYATEDSLSDIFQSDYMKNMRQSFRENKKIEACDLCWNDEKNGKESKRQLSIRTMELDEEKMENLVLTEPTHPTFLQLIITNQCNLKCRTCNPISSTKWIKEASDRGLVQYDYKRNRELYSEDSVFRLTQEQWFKNIEIIEFMGGEPFQQKELQLLLDRLIELDYAKNIKIFFSTNATSYPEKLIQKCRAHFKFLGINLSIDGINERYNYMRHGGHWSAVAANINNYYLNSLHPDGYQFKEYTIVSQITISWMNILYVPEVFLYFKENCPQLERFTNFVYFPLEYNAINLPVKVKKYIRNYFERFQNDLNIWPDLENILNHIENSQSDSFTFQVGMVAIHDGDLYRKESYKNDFPEMYELIKDEWEDMLKNYNQIKLEAYNREFLMIDNQLNKLV